MNIHFDYLPIILEEDYKYYIILYFFLNKQKKIDNNITYLKHGIPIHEKASSGTS
jgi:hypothetical protein